MNDNSARHGPVGAAPNAHPTRWRHALLPLVCVVVLLVSLGWSQMLTFDVAGWPGERLSRADAWIDARGDSAVPPADNVTWHAVTLPDNWKLTRPQGAGSVWYRIPFDASGMTAPAILIPRLATRGRVLLNGTPLWDTGGDAPGGTGSWNSPLLLRLPTGLLRAAGNEIQIQVAGQPRYRAGLSFVQLAPYTTLRPIYGWRAFWQHDGAMLSCAISLVAGALMLVTWLRHRRETLLLFFGLSTIAWAARNSNLFLDQLPISVDAWAVLVHGGHSWFNTLFGLFVLRFTQTRWRIMEWLLWAFAIGNTALMASGRLTSLDTVVRLLTLPGLALYLVLIGLLVRKGWRDRSGESALIAATTITFVVLSLRDAMLLNSQLPYEAYYISHYTGVLMLVAIVWSLVTQLVKARAAVEALNVALEERVRQRTLELEEANAAKTRFLAAASHDLRQPAVTIGLLVGLLREQVGALPPVRAMVDRIHAAVGSMEALLNGLMDLSRLEPGTLKPRLQSVPLAWIFDAIGLHEQTAAALKGVRLRFRPTALVVTSDPVLLDQIIRNLVSNAVRYTERGGVLVGARRRGADSVIVQVWDSGVGIVEAAQARVFDEFVQLANPGRERSKGQGLGLAIVRRGAHALGHRLGLRSVPGRGSCFTIELPLATQQFAPVVAAAPPPDPLHACALWLIEDDPAVRAALAMRLTRWGAQVTTLASVAEVRRQLADCAAAVSAFPALIVSDQRLPDGCGLECIALIRVAAGYEVPAVVVTGDSAPADLARLDAAGLPVLHKPFRAAELLALLHAALPEGKDA